MTTQELPAQERERLLADLDHRIRYWRQPGIEDFPARGLSEDFARELERARAALAAQVEPIARAPAEQEPVGEVIGTNTIERRAVWFNGLPPIGTHLYAHPPAQQAEPIARAAVPVVQPTKAQREFAELSEPARRALVGASTKIMHGVHARPYMEHNPDHWLCFEFNTWDEVHAALLAVKAWDSAGYRAKDDAAPQAEARQEPVALAAQERATQIAEAFADLPDALRAHPGIKRLYRAAALSSTHAQGDASGVQEVPHG